MITANAQKMIMLKNSDKVIVILERQFNMNIVSKYKNNNYSKSVFLLSLIGYTTLLFNMSSPVMGQEHTLHYKMISTIEYSGKGQFRNQAETMYIAEKYILSDGTVKYIISPKKSDEKGSSEQPLTEFSFIFNKETKQISAVDDGTDFWAKVHNESVKSLKKVTIDYVGRTWRQAIDLSSLTDILSDKINLTLTAINVKSDKYGDMIAVRSLSEPFFIKISKGFLRARINTVFLFDSDIEDVYLSISVFEATTSANGYKETLRHEGATYKTNQNGVPVDLSNIGNDFEGLVAKVGLSRNSLEIVNEVSLPRWVSEQGFRAAQIANICSAAVCEGALNPVAAVSMPTAMVLNLQHSSAVAGTSIFGQLFGGFGWNLPTAGVIGTAIAVPIIADGDDDGSNRRVASPR